MVKRFTTIAIPTEVHRKLSEQKELTGIPVSRQIQMAIQERFQRLGVIA